jgi:hypothetical protein
MHKAAGTSRIGYINNEDHRLVESCGRNPCLWGETEPSHSHALDGPSIRNGHDRKRRCATVRRLGVAQGYEFRVAQMVHVGPVRVLDLRDKLRFQPAAFGHFVGGQAGEVTV